MYIFLRIYGNFLIPKKTKTAQYDFSVLSMCPKSDHVFGCDLNADESSIKYTKVLSVT